MTEEEVRSAIAEYRSNKEKQKPNVSEITRERDEYKGKIQQLENEKTLTGLRVRPEDLDYVAFKVNQMVTDKKDFKTAASEFLKANPRYAGQGGYRVVSTGTSAGGPGTSQTASEQINDVIRSTIRGRRG